MEDAAGNPVPNVAVVWQPSPSVSLSNFSSASDLNGIVSATVILGAVIGPAQVQVRTTGAVPVQAAFTLTVSGSSSTPTQPSTATALRILGGDNQSGPPGSRLPAPLTARVEDGFGNPIPNVAVVWQPITPQSVSLDDLITVSDANGIVSATAILSSTGLAQVQVRIANLPVLTFFNLQGKSGLTGIAVLGGVGQEAATGSRFAQPVIIQVYTAGITAAGLEVQLTSAGVPVTISGGGQSFTDSSGCAAISIQAGSTPGTALITATSGEFSVSFFLTVRALPPNALSFFNAYSGQPGAISPTEILNIYGAGFAPGLQGCSAGNQR